MTEERAAEFEAGNDPLGQRVAEIIRSRLIDGVPQDPTNDIYVLSSPGSDETVVLDKPIRHEDRGAWVQGQRYANLDQLRQAATTRELG